MRYDSNLAYDLEFKESRERIEEKVAEQKKKKKAVKSAEQRKFLGTLVLCVAIFSMCAGFMISRYVVAYESKRNVESLERDLNDLKEYYSQKSFELENSVDFTEIEKIAVTRLNMVRPERNQMVYVNIKQDDVTEVTAKEVEGVGGIVGIFKEENE